MVTANEGARAEGGGHRGRLGRPIVFGVLVALSLVPYPSVVCPKWRVEVVDARGIPRPSLKVTQHWRYYSLHSESHADERATDDSGEVVFPMRQVWASAMRRMLGAAWELARMGLRGSFGSDAYIVLDMKRPGEAGVVIVGLGEAVPRDGDGVFHREVLREDAGEERARNSQPYPRRP